MPAGAGGLNPAEDGMDLGVTLSILKKGIVLIPCFIMLIIYLVKVNLTHYPSYYEQMELMRKLNGSNITAFGNISITDEENIFFALNSPFLMKLHAEQTFEIKETFEDDIGKRRRRRKRRARR